MDNEEAFGEDASFLLSGGTVLLLAFRHDEDP